MPIWLTVLLALSGGVIGAFLVRLFDIWREGQRETQSLYAAIRVVSDELRTNISSVRLVTEMGASHMYWEMDDAAYRSVRLLLAQHLPLVLRGHLARIYVQLGPLIRTQAYFRQHLESVEDRKDYEEYARLILRRMAEDMKLLDLALLGYLQKRNKGREVEFGPNQGDWQVRDPKTGLTPYDEFQAQAKAKAAGSPPTSEPPSQTPDAPES